MVLKVCELSGQCTCEYVLGLCVLGFVYMSNGEYAGLCTGMCGCVCV